jgi:hypothetical protein
MGYDTRRRTIVLTYKAIGMGNVETSALSGLPARTVLNINKRALANGFDPNARPLNISDDVLVDAPRSGRPKKQTKEVKKLEKLVLSKVHTYENGRAKSFTKIAAEITLEGFQISDTSVRQILKRVDAQKWTTESPVHEKLCGELERLGH